MPYHRSVASPKNPFVIKIITFSFILFLGFSACTREQEDPELTRLRKSIGELETEVGGLEESLKSAPSENVNTIQQEKDLARSRLERLKERLKTYEPAAAPAKH